MIASTWSTYKKNELSNATAIIIQFKIKLFLYSSRSPFAIGRKGLNSTLGCKMSQAHVFSSWHWRCKQIYTWFSVAKKPSTSAVYRTMSIFANSISQMHMHSVHCSWCKYLSLHASLPAESQLEFKLGDRQPRSRCFYTSKSMTADAQVLAESKLENSHWNWSQTRSCSPALTMLRCSFDLWTYEIGVGDCLMDSISFLKPGLSFTESLLCLLLRPKLCLGDADHLAYTLHVHLPLC